MIKCIINGIFVGSSELSNRNGSSTTCADVYVHKLKQAFSIFRCELKFEEGQAVSIPCELRLRQDGTPYFVYLAPSDAQQNQLNNKNSSFKKEE